MRGIELRQESFKGEPVVSLRVAADGSFLTATTGELGALMGQRAQTIEPVLDDLDTFAAELIYQVNRVHSQGQGLVGFSAIQGS